MDKKIIFLTVGVFFWIGAAILMHWLGPYVFNAGILHAVFWLINFLAPAFLLPLIANATGRSKHDMLAPTCLMALPAMFLDSLAITADAMNLTHIYANTSLLAAYSGGFLLFAFWSFFFWAIIWHRR